jgi:hypothetical protein
MRIEYQISEDDFVSAARLAIRKQYRHAFFRALNIRVFGAILIATALILCILTRQFAAVWPAALVGLILMCVPILWTYQFRKQYRKMPMLHGRRSLDIDATGLHFITEQSDSRTSWELFIHFAENDDSFVLFQQGNRIFIPIPKRELTAAQIDEFRNILFTHLPSK